MRSPLAHLVMLFQQETNMLSNYPQFVPYRVDTASQNKSNKLRATNYEHMSQDKNYLGLHVLQYIFQKSELGMKLQFQVTRCLKTEVFCIGIQLSVPTLQIKYLNI